MMSKALYVNYCYHKLQVRAANGAQVLQLYKALKWISWFLMLL